MFRFRVKPPTGDLLSFDWQSMLEQLNKSDPKSGDFFMIVTNKGKDDEYRTKFMTYQETLELIMLALEKKKLRIPLSL
jgi:hypothetical protein